MQQILVYADLAGTPYRVGRLWTHARARRESATFEYDASWLDQPLVDRLIHFGSDICFHPLEADED